MKICSSFESSREPRITRTGAKLLPPLVTSRTDNLGLSDITVPVPVTIASHSLLKYATSCLDCGVVIHFEVPFDAADLPSKLVAIFKVTKGEFVLIFFSQARFENSTSLVNTSEITSIPAALNFSAPPEALGFGSFTANTTFLTPALIMASTQGGVFPKWLHGSSVTTKVEPFAFAPARFSATISACSLPALSWNPSEIISPDS